MEGYHDHSGLRTTETSQQAAAFMAELLLTYAAILRTRLVGLTAYEAAGEVGGGQGRDPAAPFSAPPQGPNYE